MVLECIYDVRSREDPVLVEFMKNYKKDVQKVYLGLGISELLFVDCVSGIHRYLVCVVCMVSVLYCGRSRCHVQGITGNCMI